MCHLLISSNESVTVHVVQYVIENCTCEKLLGVKTRLEAKLSDACKKACGKLNASVRLVPFMGLPKRCILIINLLFSYCPPIWTCHSWQQSA